MDALIPLPVAVPLLIAAALLAVNPWLNRRVADTAGLLTCVAVAVMCGLLCAGSRQRLLVYWFGGWRPREGIAVGIDFAVDPFGASLAALAAVLMAAAFLFAWHYFDSVGTLFHCLMLVFLGGVCGFCLTGDLFNLFVFFELMGATAYALTGYKTEASALEGALNFAVTNTVGAYLMLWGLALVYARTGALNFAQIDRGLQAHSLDGLVIVGFLLISLGFLIKGAVVPFHFWLADAHAVAPTPVCVLFSGVMVLLGVFGVFRVYWTAFGVLEPHAEQLSRVFVGLGAVTACTGAVMCFLQRHLKRLLAFSTISHMGVVLMGMGLLSVEGTAGAAIYGVSHGLIKGGLFLAAGLLLNTLGDVDETVLRWRGHRTPMTGLLMTLGGLGLADCPPLGTSTGKALMERAADSTWFSAVVMFASILTGGAVLRAAGRIFLGAGPADTQEREAPSEGETRETRGVSGRTPWVMLSPGLILVALAALIGLWPAVVETAGAAAGSFLDRKGYAAAVLDDTSNAGISETQLPQTLSLSEQSQGFLSAAGACLLACGALFRHWVPRGFRQRVRVVVRPFVSGLETIHSGNVCDYLAWLMCGAAVLGALLALALR